MQICFCSTCNLRGPACSLAGGIFQVVEYHAQKGAAERFPPHSFPVLSFPRSATASECMASVKHFTRKLLMRMDGSPVCRCVIKNFSTFRNQQVYTSFPLKVELITSMQCAALLVPFFDDHVWYCARLCRPNFTLQRAARSKLLLCRYAQNELPSRDGN